MRDLYLKEKQKMKILIVDDTPSNLLILGEELKREYEVFIATSGEDALNQAFSNPPDLILLDIVMPGIDGYEVNQRLKKRRETERIPVLFLTSKTREEDEIRGLQEGAVDYITKPFCLPVVKARIKAQLKLKKSIEELEKLYTRLDREVRLATEIHLKTLPREIPTMNGVSMAMCYKPAYRLGGDFFNCIKLDNKLLFYFSDVTGHGIEGALMSVFVKEAINSYIRLKPEEISPSALLYHLKKEYGKASYPEDYFISILLCLLDLNTYTLTYNGAGFHIPIGVFMGGGESWELYHRNLPLSATIPLEMMNYQDHSLELTPGTTLLISTDGLPEKRANGLFYEERLNRVFNQNTHLPPLAICHAIYRDYCYFQQGSFEDGDDITFGILQIDPKKREEHYVEVEPAPKGRKRLEEEVRSRVESLPKKDEFIEGLLGLVEEEMKRDTTSFKRANQERIIVRLYRTPLYIHGVVNGRGMGTKKTKGWDFGEGSFREGKSLVLGYQSSNHIFYDKKGDRVLTFIL